MSKPHTCTRMHTDTHTCTQSYTPTFRMHADVRVCTRRYDLCDSLHQTRPFPSLHYVTTLPNPKVPTAKITEWEESYETLSEYIVPRSSSRIALEDKDAALYTVTMFRRVVEDFKQAAREKRFTVKDFECVTPLPPPPLPFPTPSLSLSPPLSS